MARAVSAALSAATIDERDRGTAELARRYAALIDNATPASKYRAPLDELAQAIGYAEDIEAAEKALDKIKDALAAHSVASDLGPKLLAALGALGLSVAGRAGKTIGSTDGGAAATQPAARPETQLERLRRERERLAGVDGA